uniref:RNA-directed RNA polymerase L n=1 Tax=Prairie sphagnum bunyavirus TaxID=2933088 RepID=A0A9C7LLM3_9VIRU|nr:RNA-dependent RNA polymerase [Prairie sphagnum bunyavirus]CAI5383892.1 RNA-dependent RNA polymerase [Prairie sphagnum bunyavirus]
MDENLVCEVCIYNSSNICITCGLARPGQTLLHPSIDALYNEYIESGAVGDMPDRYCFNCGTNMFDRCAVCGSPGEEIMRANEILLNATIYNATCLQCYENPCICVLDDIRQILGSVHHDDFDYCSMPEMEDCTSESSAYSVTTSDISAHMSLFDESDFSDGSTITRNEQTPINSEIDLSEEILCLPEATTEDNVVPPNVTDEADDVIPMTEELVEADVVEPEDNIEEEKSEVLVDDTEENTTLDVAAIDDDEAEAVDDDEAPEPDGDDPDDDDDGEGFTKEQESYMISEKDFLVSEQPEIQPSKLCWADVEFDDEETDFRVGFTDIHDSITDFACCPRCFMESPDEDIDGMLPRALYCLGSFSKLDKLECRLNSVRHPVYVMCYLQQNGYIDGVNGIMCADAFLRSRHENLSMLCADVLSLDAKHTDCKFSDVFDIDSDRTPDFIVKVGADKYLIVEVTATSDIEKAAKGKGIASLGYEPKYEQEIKILRLKNFFIEYVVIVFDMHDQRNEEYKIQIEKCASFMGKTGKLDYTSLDFVKREYCTCSQHFNKLFSMYFGYLFNKRFKLKSDFSSGWMCWIDPGKAWFTRKYEVIKVNMYIYDKLARNCHKLLLKLEQVENQNKSGFAELSYDSARGAFYFKDSPNSVPIEMWRNMLLSENFDSVCLMLKYRVSGVANPIPKAELEYFQLVDDIKRVGQLNLYPFYSYHPTSYLAPVVEVNTTPYQGLYSEALFGNFHYLDDGYEEKIIKSITEMDSSENNIGSLNKRISKLKPTPFASMRINKTLIMESVSGYQEKMKEINEGDGTIKITHAKPPFLLPVYRVSSSSYKDYKTKPSFISDLVNYNLGPLTNRIVQVVNSENFTFGGNKIAVDVNSEVRKKLAEVGRRANSLQKNYMRETGRRTFPKLVEVPGGSDLIAQLSELNRKLRSETKNSKKEYSLIRMPTSGKSEMHDAFEAEMQHFKKKGTISTFKGVGLHIGHETSKKYYDGLKNVLLSQTGVDCPDDYYSDHVAEDSGMLMDLKQKHISDNRDFKKYLMGTFLYHSAAFVSRLCHTLMFLSQTPTGGDNFCVDNLGYDDVLLIVKGGKKIFGTKRSRLFRLIYPTFESNADMHFPAGLDSSFRRLEVKGKLYMSTPWMNLHETVVSDGITFVNRVAGFITLNRCSEDHHVEIDKCYFNVILSYHNRRKTEAFLHNLRYITMNCLAIFSNVSDMLKELAGFNYDCFQSYVRGCISLNFSNFACKLKNLHDMSHNNIQNALREINLKNIFNDHIMSTVHDLANSVYSTYLMSKAPTTQVLEQYSNFKDMLDTHSLFMGLETDVFDGKLDVTIDRFPKFEEYYTELHKNDFNYDPKFCVLIGKFLADYLSSNYNKSVLQSKWDKILNEPWDEFANTKGLRGGSDEFFGTKGYYVVYKDYLERNPGYLQQLVSVITSEDSQDRKKKAVDKLNESYRDVLREENLDNAIFHVVDKKQRGGRREIFVMDLATKKQQQPIEKFCSDLCKLIPNEMISIPSNKRLSTIHSKVFEGQRTNGEHFYLVFDCRKWAPRSLVHKFVLFLSGMKELLPNGFLMHCYSFLYKMTNKRLYTKPHIVDMIKNNKSIKNVDFEWLVEDKDRKGFYMNMSYSWMMGIFNYFSSLMHVANQMYVAHLLRLTTAISFNSEFHLQMVAHSDDSAGKAICKDVEHMSRGLFIYQTLLKSSNHMLSMKKSNCGQAYYEFLSILYIGGTLLSLLAKFTGLFNFHPSDGGYCQDISESYSKCVELFMNGATFEKCYIAFKIQVNLIRRFYFQSTKDEFLYNYPPCMLGIPDAHPIMVIVCGSDADLVRIMYQNQKKDPDKNKRLLLLNEVLSNKNSNMDGFLKTIKATPNVKMHKRLQELKENYETSGFFDNPDLLWPLVNVNFKNSAMNAIKFLKKLDDKIFLASLQDESLTRRISRSYYFRSSYVLETSRGVLSYKQLKQLIAFAELSEVAEPEELTSLAADIMNEVKAEIDNYMPRLENLLFNFLHSEPVKLYKYLDRLAFEEEKLEPSIKKTKPLKISIKRSLDCLDFKFSPQEMATWVKYPELRLLLPNTRNFSLIEHELKLSLTSFSLNVEELTVEQLTSVLLKMSKKADINIFCYSNVPTSLREVTTYQDMLNLLAHNSFTNKYIKGLAVPFGKTMGVLAENVLEELSGIEVQWTLSLLLLMSALLKDELVEKIFDLELNLPAEFRANNITLKDVVKFITDYWFTADQKIYSYLKVDLLIMQSLMDKNPIGGEILENAYYHSFVKRQFLAQNVWLGVGQLVVGLGDVQLCFLISGQKINSVLSKTSEYSFSQDQVNYLNLVLRTAQLYSLKDCMREIEIHESEHTFLGFDRNGCLSVDSGGYFLIGLSVQLDYNLRTELSNPRSGRIDVMKGSKIKWTTCINDRNKSYTVNTISVNSSDAINLLRGLIADNEKNKELIKSLPSSFSFDLLQSIYKNLDVELEISKNTFFENIHNTKIYRILKRCRDLSLCTVKVSLPRLKSFPAQDGGLLSALIEYSKVDKEFDFKWDRILTREYLNLKATQPDAFMTNLMSNLRENFKNLYDADDKTAIVKELSSLAKIRQDENFEETLFSMLCNWGYIGVAGALDTTSSLDVERSFKNIRVYREKFPFISLYIETLVKLIPILYKSTMISITELGGNVGLFAGWYAMTVDNLKYHFMSFIHSNVLKAYTNRIPDDIDVESCSVYLYSFLETISCSSQGSQNFNDSIAAVPLLSNLILNNENINEWVRIYFNLRLMWLDREKYDVDLNFLDKLQRLDVETPFKKTQKLVESCGLKLSAANVYHHGVLGNEYFEEMKRPYRSQNNKQILRVINEFIEDVDSITSIDFNVNYWLQYPLSEDFVETDEFEDFVMEFQCAEIDVETIDQMIEDSEIPVFKREKAIVTKIYEGPFKTMLTINLKTILLFGRASRVYYLSKIRQAGVNVALISDYIPYHALKNKEAFFRFFRLVSHRWINKSITNPGSVFISLLCKYGDNEYWEQYFGAKSISIGELKNLLNIGSHIQINRLGMKEDCRSFIDLSAQESNEIFEQRIDLDEQERRKSNEEASTSDRDAENERIIKIMKTKGYDSDIIKQFLKNTEKGDPDIRMMNILKTLLGNEEFISSFKKEVLEVAADILKKPMTSKQNEQILQIAPILASMQSKTSDLRNRVLDDKELLAELNCIAPNCIYKIITNRLNITPKLWQVMYNKIKTYRRLIKTLKKNVQDKIFLLNLFTLIINDTNVITDSSDNDEKVLIEFSDWINNKFIDDEDDEDPEEDMFQRSGEGARINYNPTFEPARFHPTNKSFFFQE